MAVQPYTVRKTINGKEYVAQFNGLSAAFRAVDTTYIDGSNNTSVTKMANYLFEHVIVEPKGLTIDDFETTEEFNEVFNFARKTMQGEFRGEKDKDTNKESSKK